jgi:Fe-S cluster assembly iron-binding protein IscA
MIEITESAQKKIREYIEENKVDLSVRLFLSQGG